MSKLISAIVVATAGLHVHFETAGREFDSC